MTPDQLMILASAAAYSIDPKSGHYAADNIYGVKAGFLKTRVVNATVATIDEEGNEDKQLVNACLIGQTSDAVIVAFRGTLFGENEDAFWDWVQDFMADTVYAPPLPGKVHSGFYGALKKMFNAIAFGVRTLRGSRNLPVYVTGHSKGGGMAPLCAYLLWRVGMKPQYVTTFAAPETGDADFKQGYEAVITNHVRYENYGDIVPFLPPDADVVDIIADAVAYFDADVAKFIRKAATWGYVAVGSKKFIESAADDYAINDDEPSIEQAGDIAINIWDVGSVEQAIVDAHHVVKGYGYMSGVCPGMFDSSTGAGAVPA